MITRAEIKQTGQAVGRLTLPVLIEQFFIVIMGVVNTMMASNMGKEAISAIGMIDTISNIVISVFSALAIGGTVVVAQYTGREDHNKANQAAAQALISCLLIAAGVTLLIALFQKQLIQILFNDAEAIVIQDSLLYMSVILFSYVPIAMVTMAFGILRGAGDTRTPMKVSILMNLFNVVGSYLLIFGLNLNFGIFSVIIPSFGIRGAALGLTIARTLGMLLVLIPLLKGSRAIKLTDMRHFRFDWEMLRSIFSLGVPAGAEQLMFNGGKLITQTFIVRLGTVAMAANSISNSIISLMMIPGNAMAIAATTVVGQEIGRGRPREARRQLVFLIVLSSLSMVVTGLPILPLLSGFISLYTQDAATMATAATIVSSALIAQPLIWSMSFLSASGLRGAGDVRYTMIVSIISMWTLRILLGYAFTVWLPMGVLGIWFAMYIDWIGRSIFFMHRIKGKRWLLHDMLH